MFLLFLYLNNKYDGPFKQNDTPWQSRHKFHTRRCHVGQRKQRSLLRAGMRAPAHRKALRLSSFGAMRRLAARNGPSNTRRYFRNAYALLCCASVANLTPDLICATHTANENMPPRVRCGPIIPFPETNLYYLPASCNTAARGLWPKHMIPH